MTTPYAVRQFSKDYGLPVLATLVLLCILLLLFIIRIHEHSVLAGVLSTKTVAGKNYADLLSNDTVDDLKKNAAADESKSGQSAASPSSNAASTPANATAPFTISASSTPSSGGSNSTTSATSVTPTPTPVPTPPPPFSASILRFTQQNASISCGSNKNKLCTKTYSFSANVGTANGPGTVAYSWKSNNATGNLNGSFTVGTGDTSTSIQQQITLSCTQPSTFTMQLAVTSPNSVASNILTVQHSCI